MPMFEITRVYKYTTKEIVEAENYSEAVENSNCSGEVRNNDDRLYSEYTEEV